MTYPNSPGYAHNSETSRQAALSIWKPTEMQALVMIALHNGGLTDHEISQKLGMDICRTQPRRSELSKMNPPRIVDSGKTRSTPYGKNATVWELANGY